MRKAREGYTGWENAVDEAVYRIAGVSLYDLPDVDLWSWWEDGYGPSSAARKALRNAGYGREE